MRQAKPACADCGREIMWATTEARAKIALDPRRDDEHGRFAVHRDVHGALRARVPTDDNRRDPWEHMYDPHIASCPAEAKRRVTDPAPLAQVVPISAARSF